MRYQLLFSTDKWHSRMEYLRQVTSFLAPACCWRATSWLPLSRLALPPLPHQANCYGLGLGPPACNSGIMTVQSPVGPGFTLIT